MKQARALYEVKYLLDGSAEYLWVLAESVQEASDKAGRWLRRKYLGAKIEACTFEGTIDIF